MKIHSSFLFIIFAAVLMLVSTVACSTTEQNVRTTKKKRSSRPWSEPAAWETNPYYGAGNLFQN